MLVTKSAMRSQRLITDPVILAFCLCLSMAAARPVFGQEEKAAAKAQKAQKAQIVPKPEDVVERAILAYGSRVAVYGVQRNGTLRALVKFIGPDGAREGKSVTRFIRKPTLKEDLLMIDLELPGTKYIIGFDGKQTWAIHDGEIQEPGADAVRGFRSAHEHSYEALLRYKENSSKLEYAGSYKLATLELDLIDLITPEGVRTRYEISRKSGHVIYLAYEEKPEANAPPVKYRLYFKNFRWIQNTLVPYETVVYQDDKVIEERRVVESVFNVQLEEKAFKAENVLKPADALDKP
ncbi:MAG: hypothetical protein ACKVX9_09705 [Blastocatellia bacterium]